MFCMHDLIFFLFIFLPVHYRCFVLAIVLALLCVCSLWKKRRQLCGWGTSRPHYQSEGDSTGSCYAPPQYSRCNSFHHAPPPYMEVCIAIVLVRYTIGLEEALELTLRTTIIIIIAFSIFGMKFYV